MILTVDGIDLSTYGFVLDSAQGLPSGRSRDYVLASIAGRPGPSRSGRRGRPRERRVVIKGYILGPDRATCEDQRDAIMYLLEGDSERQYIFPNRTNRYLKAVLEQPDISGIAPAFTQRGLEVSIGILAADPRLFETTNQSVSFGAAATTLPLGNAPVDLVVTLANGGGGAVAGPLTVNLLASDGVTLLAYLTLGDPAVSIPAGQTLTINMREQLVYLGAGTALSDHHPDWVTDGDFWNPDPALHAGGPTGPYPMAELQPLATGLTATATYARTWL